MSKTTDVMIDTEFLSFDFSSVILSIGLAGFNIDEYEFKARRSLYVVPTMDSQKGAVIDQSVFEFWMNAKKSSQDAIFKHPKQVSIVQALLLIEDFFKYELPDVERVWAHGGACDVPLLAQTFRDYNRIIPWGYKCPRDTRTLYDYNNYVNISPYLKSCSEEQPEHHALYDAIRQAEAVHAVHASIKRRLSL